MVKPNTTAEAMAREAAARIDAARAAGEQLTFLPDEPQPGDSGRAVRGKGKAASQLRDWLAARGMRLPEDQLAEMAGLNSREDVILTAMANTERLLGWAESGGRTVVQVVKDGVLIEKELDNRATTGQRLETFKFVYTAALRAAEALLPYGLAKVTPDVAAQPAVQVVVMPAGQAASGAQPGPQSARDVTPQARKLAPPPMPWEMQQNQQVADAEVSQSGLSDRTEGPRR